MVAELNRILSQEDTSIPSDGEYLAEHARPSYSTLPERGCSVCPAYYEGSEIPLETKPARDKRSNKTKASPAPLSVNFRNIRGLHSNLNAVHFQYSGYPQRPWLMTPILDPVDGSPEALYNDKHAPARVVIENVFGRLKNRWRCSCKDRVLHYKPKKCAQIIQACSLLHNFFLNFQGPETDRNEDYRDDESSSHAETYREPPGSNTTYLIRGRSMRQQLVHRLHH